MDNERFEEEVVIGQEYDGFTIVIGDKRWRFDQEETVEEGMLDLFKFLGYENIVYEDWY